MILSISTTHPHYDLLNTIATSLTVNITMLPGDVWFYDEPGSWQDWVRVLTLPATDETIIAVMMEIIKYKKSLDKPELFWYNISND